MNDTSICIQVPGPPQAQKRHRHVNRGGFTRTYDPSASDKADFLAICLQKRPETPLEGPIMLQILAVMPRPKSHFTKKGLRLSAPLYHTSKPDADNLSKLVKDALNGVFWKDDSQVCKLFVTKAYGTAPRTEIQITPISDN
jgi:Holliday junction resolvase RusA-like endonuclease